jgi:DNA-binding CsgD family transcriptional regulator
MRHLIIAAYVLLLGSGFAGVAALAFLRLRVPSRVASRLLAIQSLLVVGLLAVLVYSYLQAAVPAAGEDLSALRGWLGVVSSAAQAGLYAFAFLLARELRTGVGLRPWLRAAARVACIVVAAVSALVALYGLARLAGPAGLPRLPASLAGPEYALTCAAILLLGFCLLRAPLQGEHSAVRFLARGWGVSLLGFVPLTVVEWALDGSGLRVYAPLSLDYLFYAACGVCSTVAFVRSLRGEGPPDGEAARFVVTDDVAARFGLTSRERQMAPLIARGLGNKQIGAELGISPATVRTHVYNLFQKVGVTSRIGLLNALRS